MTGATALMACLNIALDYGLTRESLRNLKIGIAAHGNHQSGQMPGEKMEMWWYWACGRRCIVSRCLETSQSGT